MESRCSCRFRVLLQKSKKTSPMTNNNLNISGDLAALLKSQISKANLSDDACAERFLGVEGVIDNYERAVTSGSAELPSREEIGLACFWLLFLVGALKRGGHLNLVVRLLTPSIGVRMYELLPLVLALRDHAIQLVEVAAKVQTDESVNKVAPREDQRKFDLF